MNTEELESLPDGSAVVTGYGDVGQKVGDVWHFPGTTPATSRAVSMYKTVRLLYAPQEIWDQKVGEVIKDAKLGLTDGDVYFLVRMLRKSGALK